MADDPNVAIPKPNDPNAAVPKPNGLIVAVGKRKTDWSQLLPILIYGVIALAILGAIAYGLSGQKDFSTV